MSLGEQWQKDEHTCSYLLLLLTQLPLLALNKYRSQVQTEKRIAITVLHLKSEVMSSGQQDSSMCKSTSIKLDNILHSIPHP